MMFFNTKFMPIIKRRKKALSKNEFILQENSGSKTDLEEFDDEILRHFPVISFGLIDRVNEIGLPLYNEQIRLVTKKSFNALEFIKYILGFEKIIETYICVYSIDSNSGSIINHLAEKGILGNTVFLISNLKNPAYRQKYAIVREKFIKNSRIKLIFAASHAKLMLIKTERNHYVVEGSMNLSSNSRIEQCLFENNQTVYNFHKQWIDNIEEIATDRELAIYDFNGEKIKGNNKYIQR
ncbi:hypothetical protein Barb6_03470 [Bacteroidales bacterium Barb6]|nr:hypothetical protein Barb6_03470 [Bacteroidales bacterium Barb6]OAV75930.1 hypothetical protein Barb7_00415 [Bacteroidales bacterium Barb7]